MTDEELAVDEKNIGFYAAKSLIDRVEQWPLVLVVVVSMRADKRRRFASNDGSNDRQANDRKCDY
ncbi:MAG TPA: hypothetical protein VG055_06905 [Planctomycetaceae bacterium]|nr:hypothetical protein [Planctomycetaceae bacterium]